MRINSGPKNRYIYNTLVVLSEMGKFTIPGEDYQD